MKRTVFLLASLLPIVSASAGESEPSRQLPASARQVIQAAAPRPNLQPGWRFTVTRTGSMLGTITVGQDVYPLRTSNDFQFIEDVIQTEDGRPTEVLREVVHAELQGVDPESLEVEVRQLAPAGRVFRVVSSTAGPLLYDARTGEREWDDELGSVFSVPTVVELWPTDGPLAVGQRWFFEGAELTRRLVLISAEDGRLDLEVERIELDPRTGLETAWIRGHLSTSLPLYVVSLDYEAAVELELPLELGIPTRLEFDGAISLSWSYEDATEAPVVLQVQAQGKALQLCTPSEEVLAALRGKPLS